MVKNALNNARKGRTIIIIAHRLTTIRNADIIFVFDKGNIVEQGTHEELVQISGGIYQKLASQLDIEEDENSNQPVEIVEIEDKEEDEDDEDEEAIEMQTIERPQSRSPSCRK